MSEPTDTPSPLTDAEIEVATIGHPIRIDGPIQLQDSDPSGPNLFAREAARIRTVLGRGVLLLEHVGSTAVPGLAAKPIIDLVLAVEDSADEDSYVPTLEAAGYALTVREPDWREHRMFKGPDTNINLHVFTQGSPEIARMITFRDHLRTSPEDLTLYEATKRELASQNWRYVQNYADAKSKVVREIMHRATSLEDHQKRNRLTDGS